MAQTKAIAQKSTRGLGSASSKEWLFGRDWSRCRSIVEYVCPADFTLLLQATPRSPKAHICICFRRQGNAFPGYQRERRRRKRQREVTIQAHMYRGTRATGFSEILQLGVSMNRVFFVVAWWPLTLLQIRRIGGVCFRLQYIPISRNHGLLVFAPTRITPLSRLNSRPPSTVLIPSSL